MKYIVTLFVFVSLFAFVSPVFAAPLSDEVKPACTESSSWIDKMFGNCVELSTTTATQQGDQAGDTMTKSNPVHDNTKSWLCSINPEWSGCK